MQQNSLSITDFAQKIQDNINKKKDLIVPTQKMRIRPDVIELDTPDGLQEFEPTDHFHRQVGSFTDIPWKYYDRLRFAPDLFSHNVNHWLDQKKDSKRMIRTFNGEESVARAFLSDRYRRIDNEHIAESILPVLMANSNTQVLSSQVTDKKMYLMVAFANREAEIKGPAVKGDVIQAGIIITNSEIGMSRFTVLPYIHRLWCLNGCVVNIAGKEYGMKQIHAGRRVDAADNMIAYKDETLAADDHALQLKMRDIVASISDGPMWDEIVNGMQQAADSTEIVAPIQAVEVMAKTLNLNDSEQNSVLTNLIKSGDLSRWGAGNAITQVANGEGVDYDRATELQQIGGNVIGMREREWQTIAEAAA